MQNRLIPAVLGLLALTISMTASAEETARNAGHDPDPWQHVNRKIYAFNKAVDTHAFRPLAKGYRTVTPQVIDDALTRFFQNLKEPLTVLNDGLQGKGRQAAGDSARFILNTVTSLGFADLAAKAGLVRHDEDFGQTLGKWGVGSGPYLVLPFMGPTDLRDGSMLALDGTVNPRNLVSDTSTNIGLFVLEKVDFRADLIPLEKVIEGDEYLLMRDIYLQRRDFLVNDGKVRDTFLDDSDQ